MKEANFAPVYAACMYTELATIARAHGYALAVHGSLARDLDLIAIPWIEDPSTPQEVIDQMCKHYSITQAGEPTEKHHGRLAFSLVVQFGECMIDISFIPTKTPTQDK